MKAKVSATKGRPYTKIKPIFMKIKQPQSAGGTLLQHIIEEAEKIVT